MDEYKIRLTLNCAPLEIDIQAQLRATSGDEAVQTVLNTIDNHPHQFTKITAKSWNMVS